MGKTSGGFPIVLPWLVPDQLGLTIPTSVWWLWRGGSGPSDPDVSVPTAGAMGL